MAEGDSKNNGQEDSDGIPQVIERNITEPIDLSDIEELEAMGDALGNQKKEQAVILNLLKHDKKFRDIRTMLLICGAEPELLQGQEHITQETLIELLDENVIHVASDIKDLAVEYKYDKELLESIPAVMTDAVKCKNESLPEDVQRLGRNIILRSLHKAWDAYQLNPEDEHAIDRLKSLGQFLKDFPYRDTGWQRTNRQYKSWMKAIKHTILDEFSNLLDHYLADPLDESLSKKLLPIQAKIQKYGFMGDNELKRILESHAKKRKKLKIDRRKKDIAEELRDSLKMLRKLPEDSEDTEIANQLEELVDGLNQEVQDLGMSKNDEIIQVRADDKKACKQLRQKRIAKRRGKDNQLREKRIKKRESDISERKEIQELIMAEREDRIQENRSLVLKMVKERADAKKLEKARSNILNTLIAQSEKMTSAEIAATTEELKRLEKTADKARREAKKASKIASETEASAITARLEKEQAEILEEYKTALISFRDDLTNTAVQSQIREMDKVMIRLKLDKDPRLMAIRKAHREAFEIQIKEFLRKRREDAKKRAELIKDKNTQLKSRLKHIEAEKTAEKAKNEAESKKIEKIADLAKREAKLEIERRALRERALAIKTELADLEKQETATEKAMQKAKQNTARDEAMAVTMDRIIQDITTQDGTISEADLEALGAVTPLNEGESPFIGPIDERQTASLVEEADFAKAIFNIDALKETAEFKMPIWKEGETSPLMKEVKNKIKNQAEAEKAILKMQTKTTLFKDMAKLPDLDNEDLMAWIADIGKRISETADDINSNDWAFTSVVINSLLSIYPDNAKITEALIAINEEDYKRNAKKKTVKLSGQTFNVPDEINDETKKVLHELVHFVINPEDIDKAELDILRDSVGYFTNETVSSLMRLVYNYLTEKNESKRHKLSHRLGTFLNAIESDDKSLEEAIKESLQEDRGRDLFTTNLTAIAGDVHTASEPKPASVPASYSSDKLIPVSQEFVLSKADFQKELDYFMGIQKFGKRSILMNRYLKWAKGNGSTRLKSRRKKDYDLWKDEDFAFLIKTIKEQEDSKAKDELAFRKKKELKKSRYNRMADTLEHTQFSAIDDKTFADLKKHTENTSDDEPIDASAPAPAPTPAPKPKPKRKHPGTTILPSGTVAIPLPGDIHVAPKPKPAVTPVSAPAPAPASVTVTADKGVEIDRTTIEDDKRKEVEKIGKITSAPGYDDEIKFLELAVSDPTTDTSKYPGWTTADFEEVLAMVKAQTKAKVEATTSSKKSTRKFARRFKFTKRQKTETKPAPKKDPKLAKQKELHRWLKSELIDDIASECKNEKDKKEIKKQLRKLFTINEANPKDFAKNAKRFARMQRFAYRVLYIELPNAIITKIQLPTGNETNEEILEIKLQAMENIELDNILTAVENMKSVLFNNETLEHAMNEFDKLINENNSSASSDKKRDAMPKYRPKTGPKTKAEPKTVPKPIEVTSDISKNAPKGPYDSLVELVNGDEKLSERIKKVLSALELEAGKTIFIRTKARMQKKLDDIESSTDTKDKKLETLQKLLMTSKTADNLLRLYNNLNK